MSHELAKELKDAGFPLKEFGVAQRAAGLEGFVVEESWGETSYLFPTISELIEACGDFEILGRSSEEWFSEGMQTPRVYGSTPEEAVAKLWLALNTK